MLPNQLVSERMKNLAWMSLGRCGLNATTGLAIGGTASNIQTATGDAAANLSTPKGVIASSIQDTDIDLSDADVCAEAGMSIPAGRNIYLFVLQDGTSDPLVRVGEMRKTTSRSSVTAALVTTYVYDVLPNDVDQSTYVCTGYVKLVNVTNAFVVGTTLLSAAGITDTYVELSNMLVGSQIEA